MIVHGYIVNGHAICTGHGLIVHRDLPNHEEAKEGQAANIITTSNPPLSLPKQYSDYCQLAHDGVIMLHGAVLDTVSHYVPVFACNWSWLVYM